MTKNPYWLFLEELRKSGETNMWGAAPYLMKEFDVDEKEATQILLNWMQNYNRDDYKPELLRVCYKRPEDFAQEREINNSLGALQNLVGGYIEVARPFGHEMYGKNVAILCNEEGLLKKEEITSIDWGKDPERVDFGTMYGISRTSK